MDTYCTKRGYKSWSHHSVRNNLDKILIINTCKNRKSRERRESCKSREIDFVNYACFTEYHPFSIPPQP